MQVEFQYFPKVKENFKGKAHLVQIKIFTYYLSMNFSHSIMEFKFNLREIFKLTLERIEHEILRGVHSQILSQYH